MANQTHKENYRSRALQENKDYTLFPWSKQSDINPIFVKRAEGVYFYDYDDNRYLDFSSGLINVNIGYGHPRVKEAVIKQMEQFSYVPPSFATKVRGDLGKRLAELAPYGINKTLFTTSGAESIENAIKLARLYTGKHKILARYRAYHGASYGAMSLGGDPRKVPHDSQQLLNIIHLEDPYCYRCPWSQPGPEVCGRECVKHIERIIQFESEKTIAAIIMEGESGTSGCIKYPEGYLKQVRELCDKYNILLIIDEVMSGFGRVGRWFAVNLHGIIPDMITFAKGITAGYLPLGALMVSDKIAEKFNEEILWLGLTYSAHPLSCAAALEVLKIYEDEMMIDNAAEMGKYIEAKVKEMKASHPCIGDFRNTGLLGCLELVKNRKTKEPMAPFNAKSSEMTIMNEVGDCMRKMGLYALVRWNYIFLAPPLCITRKQVDEGLAVISKALDVADRYCYP